MTSRRANRGPNRQNRLAVRIIEVSVLMLPAGRIRRRYERELVAELFEQAHRRQIRYAVGTLVTAWSLRNAATGREQRGATMLITKRKQHRAIFCVLTVGHSWHKEFTEENTSYLCCRRCGKITYGDDGMGDLYLGVWHP